MTKTFEMDALQLFLGDPYVINDNIIINQPKIGDVAAYGESAYFSMVHTLTAIPSNLKSQLDDMGLDYEQVSDFDLFIMLSRTLTKERTEILIGKIDLSNMRPFKNPQNDEIILVDKENGIIIDRFIYERMVNHIRKMHCLKKKVEKAKNAMTKKILIEEDRRNIELNKNKPYNSFLMPLISAVKARQGYTLDYIKNEGLVEFFDEVNRLQIIHNADALLSACYSGFCDTSKMDKKALNWMRDVNEDNQQKDAKK
jgi:hypothetical protein